MGLHGELAVLEPTKVPSSALRGRTFHSLSGSEGIPITLTVDEIRQATEGFLFSVVPIDPTRPDGAG
jgi:hypothetical protein